MLRHRRRRQASELPWRVEVGTVLETNFGNPLTVLAVSYNPMSDKVMIVYEAEAPNGEIVEDERSWDYIVENYLE